jgi:O-antigen/teichoic acid export membrane protein
VAGSLLHLLVLLKLSSPLIRLRPFEASHSWADLRIAAPFVLWSVFSIVYFRIDALMLGSMSPEEVTGWYGGAYRFFDAIMILPALLKSALYPVFSRLVADTERALAPMFEASVRLVLLIAIPLSCLMWAMAPQIIDLFMGLSDYGPAVVILRIFSVGIPLMFVDFILVGALIASTDRLRSWVWVGAWAIALNVGLNMALIPHAQGVHGNGAAGAAIATVVTEGFILISAIRHLPAVMFQRFENARYARLFAMGGGLAFLTMAMTWWDAPWIAQAAVLPAAAVAATWAGSLLKPSEWAFLVSFLRSVSRRFHHPTSSNG